MIYADKLKMSFKPYFDGEKTIGQIIDEQQPIIQHQRMQGHWIDTDDNLANCSNCGYQIDIHLNRGYMNYCPNCGAEMNGGEKDADSD